MFIVALSFANAGAPSATRRWKGFLRVGPVREELTTVNLTDRWFLGDPSGKSPLMILPRDQIITKTGEGTVATGSVVNGRLFLCSAGDRRQLMGSLNWSVEVVCEDCFNHSFTGILIPHPGVVTDRKIYPGEQPIPPDIREELKKLGEKNEQGVSRRSSSSGKVQQRNIAPSKNSKKNRFQKGSYQS
jgi:hypothetical protein